MTFRTQTNAWLDFFQQVVPNVWPSVSCDTGTLDRSRCMTYFLWRQELLHKSRPMCLFAWKQWRNVRRGLHKSIETQLYNHQNVVGCSCGYDHQNAIRCSCGNTTAQCSPIMAHSCSEEKPYPHALYLVMKGLMMSYSVYQEQGKEFLQLDFPIPTGDPIFDVKVIMSIYYLLKCHHDKGVWDQQYRK